ncbi:MAG: AbgT family transporter [Clostridium sp.]|nr:AbgT family transporter [Clostridium sp.]MCM1443799.1 AbgT family transporter [Candidatus Amulumruptor caecigallinarius]
MDKSKDKSKKYIGAISIILILTLFIMILSLILGSLNISGEQTSISNGLLQTSLVTIKNIFSIDGIKFLLGSAVKNFQTFSPLIILILSIMCTSILESSGLLEHIFGRLGKLKTSIITFLTLLISILFIFFGEYSYLFLFPLIAAIYKAMGKNPVSGLITVFLGITLGYSFGIFMNGDNYSLGLLTEQAATLDVDPTYRFNSFSTIYIMLSGALLLLFLLTIFIERKITNNLKKVQRNDDEYNHSISALIISIIVFIILAIITFIFTLSNSPLVDIDGNSYVTKLFGDNSIFKDGLIYIVLLILILVGSIYGKISKNFKNDAQSNVGISTNFDGLGYVFAIMFFGVQLISVLDYTNIGTVIITGLTNLLSVMEISGIFLIIIFMLIVVITSVLVPSLTSKWVLMAPIIVPLFMRANITPEFCQYLYVFFSTISRCVTPFFIYLIILIGFINKYNIEDEEITLTGVLKLMLPTILSVVGIMILFVFLWYISGIPVGISGYPTL